MTHVLSPPLADDDMTLAPHSMVHDDKLFVAWQQLRRGQHLLQVVLTQHGHLGLSAVAADCGYGALHSIQTSAFLGCWCRHCIQAFAFPFWPAQLCM